MTPLTALDLARIKFRRFGDDKHLFDCPSCGGLAWAGRAHLQCTSIECKHKVFAPLDILHLVWKESYVDCATTAATLIGRAPDHTAARGRKSARYILDYWCALCKLPRTVNETIVSSSYVRSGFDTINMGASAAILDGAKLKNLITLAHATGATFPDQWLTEPPGTSLVYCVQSVPHTIDRLVVVSGTSHKSITWSKRRAGFTGLLDVNPSETQFLVESELKALALQQKLRRTGHVPHVMSVFNDLHAEFAECNWIPEDIPLVAVLSDTQSIIDIQRTLDQFKGLEEVLTATTEHDILGLQQHVDPQPWNHMRRGAIRRMNSADAKRVSAISAFLFEQTGSRTDDAAFLVSRFTSEGRIELAESMRQLSENHVIYQDQSCKVKESYNSYRVFTRHEARDIANFSLRLKASVIFGDAHSEVYYQGVVGHGNKKTNALISRNALESVKHLQQELQVVAAGGDGVIPTVIDIGQMRGKVMPYLAAQAARLPVIKGISFLGWSPDRSFFQAPGLAVGIDGIRRVDPVFHPAIMQLRPFKEAKAWSEACPELVKDAQTIIAMMLALTVRSYKRCAIRPIKVIQSSDALTLLYGIMEALGQENILELNSNARDTRIQQNSIVGYPCVAAGYSNQQISQSNNAYVILTDEGLMVTDHVSKQDADDAGRAMQFALVRLVEWCIATQADEFREIQSTDWHNSLMREGQWIMEHVCKLQPWEVKVNFESDLERVFSQIPLASIHDRMVILNGTTLRVNCEGLDVNVEGVTKECGADCVFQDNSLLIPAAQIITSVHRFYGCDPGIKAVLA